MKKREVLLHEFEGVKEVELEGDWDSEKITKELKELTEESYKKLDEAATRSFVMARFTTIG